MTNQKINFQGKSAFVTGSNRGIGKAITQELLARGAKKVYAAARDVATLNNLKEKYADRLIPIKLDVTNENDIQKITQEIKDVDILINNAGVLHAGGIFSEDAKATLKNHLDVNVYGLVHLTQGLVDTIKSRPESAIVNVSSMAGLANMPSIGTYSVSKASVHSITQGMRAELAESPTLVAGVYPGPVDTDMTKGFEMEMDTPQNVAKNLLDQLAAGVEDIFPDAMSAQVGPAWGSAPKQIEEQFATFI